VAWPLELIYFLWGFQHRSRFQRKFTSDVNHGVQGVFGSEMDQSSSGLGISQLESTGLDQDQLSWIVSLVWRITWTAMNL
jgi:hypothetical protein